MRRRVLAILRGIALVLIATVLLLPIYWLIMSSFRPAGDIFRFAGQFGLETLIPQRLTLENYQQIFAASFPRALFNSLFVCFATVTLGVVVNSMAGQQGQGPVYPILLHAHWDGLTVADVVFPGEPLTVSGWKQGDRHIVQASTPRGIVLSNAYAIVE